MGTEERARALTVQDVHFSYTHAPVLCGVSLEVFEGEALALLGTNGAGKSTLLRVVSGLETPSSGSVQLRDTHITTMPAEERCRLGISLAVGGKGVFPDLTVRENLVLGAYTVRHGVQERIDAELSRFPRLAARLDTAAGSLSGGEQQQLVLAQALMRRPGLLCIDELSLGLSPNLVSELLAVVHDIHRSGVTCILVEQSLNIAAQVCERAVFLEKGEVRFEGRTADILERGDLARAIFLGSEGFPGGAGTEAGSG